MREDRPWWNEFEIRYGAAGRKMRNANSQRQPLNAAAVDSGARVQSRIAVSSFAVRITIIV